ncbi:MAG: O-antigen ligase family protein [Pyrinomonadaceae bacterium]|nr:O-antigen ligase family protein [Pyrinomonadaceae bacterium]MBP6214052.1 O-antigen ligase family protein [Pyrinomonadaceae bacterium]
MSPADSSSKANAIFEPVLLGDTSSRLSGAIYVLLCLIPVFSTIVFGGVDQGSWVVLIIALAAVVLLWLADAWYGRALLLNRSMLLVPLLLLIALGTFQTLPLFSPDLPAALVGEPHRTAISLDPYSTRLFVIRLIGYLVFFSAALTFINNDKRLRRTVSLIIVFGSLMAFFGILQRLANPDAIYGIRGTPQAIPFGSFVNQHHFASFMVMVSGVTLAFLFGSDIRRERRLLLGVAAILLGMAAVMTSSRGGMISLVGTIIFVLLATYMSRVSLGKQSEGLRVSQSKTGLAAAGTALIVLVLGMVMFLGENNALIRSIGLSGAEDITSGRTHFWKIALRIFLDHPILGAGLDAFGVAFTRYDTWPGVFRVEQAHNDYLQTLADAGIIGFACICGFIFLVFKKGLASIANAREDYHRTAAIGALAGCFGILIHSFFDFPLRTPANAFFFLTLVVVAVSHVRRRHS